MAKRTVGAEGYYTRAALARECVRLTDALLPLEEFAAVVEPSAGAGAFFDLLPPGRRLGIDLSPSHPAVHHEDFLAWDWHGLPAGPTLVIGNPPFGRRGALALDFVERAAQFADAIAFILPRSFNKWTFQNRFPPPFHLLAALDCEDFALADGTPHPVRAVFQVWERRGVARPRVRPETSHPDFELRHAHLSRTGPATVERLRAEYAFAIPQVGGDFRPRDPRTLSRGSHWFVKPRADHVRGVFELLDFSFLDGTNTALTSLARADIVRAYEAARGRGGDGGPGAC